MSIYISKRFNWSYMHAYTIYVRVFEDHMDILRAVMVGASGTPYHDGLFFFDLQLPPSYPAEPPLVHYRSFSLHVNPNLYPSGTVCLSLLNTFGGQHKAELWSPEASTILQVVVSIQGLVLTAQPYYNEPAQPWVNATSSRIVRAPSCKASRPCSTSCVGRRQDSRGLSETTSAAVGSV
jgi:ubiquitin-protein ligase